MYKCKTCQETLPKSSFSKNKAMTQGHNTKCKECSNAKRRAVCQSNRDYVAAYKLEKGCSCCGYNKYSFALDLAHIDPTTKWSYGKKDYHSSDAYRPGWPREKLIAELDKCKVLCANCHREETFLGEK